MARANPDQLASLESLKERVLEVMASLSLFEAPELRALEHVPLGVLRRNATQRHGVTRWKVLASGSLEVESVDLHPELLNQAWRDYAEFVLYHEYLHAMGHRAHDQRFRALESLWPNDGQNRGKAFTNTMRLNRAQWMWECPTCGQGFPRQRRGAGRFLCRTCRCVLVDVPIENAQ